MNIRAERLKYAMKHKAHMDKISDRLDENLEKLELLQKTFDGSKEWQDEWKRNFGKESMQAALVKAQYIASKLLIDRNRMLDIIEECMPKESARALTEADVENNIEYFRDIDRRRDANGRIVMPQEVKVRVGGYE